MVYVKAGRYRPLKDAVRQPMGVLGSAMHPALPIAGRCCTPLPNPAAAFGVQDGVFLKILPNFGIGLLPHQPRPLRRQLPGMRVGLRSVRMVISFR